MLQAIPPIHITVQQAPTPLWTILAPLILSAVLGASTIYYGWRMHQLAMDEKKRRDAEELFRAEGVGMQLNRLQIGLKEDRPLGQQAYAVLYWDDGELERLLRNSHPATGLNAGDFEVVHGMIRTLRGFAERMVATPDDYDDHKQFLRARSRLMEYLEARRGKILRGE